MEATVVLESTEQPTPIDRTLVFRLEDAEAAAFAYAPGQFIVLREPAYDDKLKRAYSFSHADRQDGRLRITVRDMGDFGAHLYRLELGARLFARPPQGKFVLDLEDPLPLLLVAGGSGVTPFHAFLEALQRLPAPPACTLLQSARVAEELIFHASFRALAEAMPAFTYVPTVTRAPDEAPWEGRRGRIDEALLAAHIEDAAALRFYVCGSGAFVKGLLGHAEATGIPKEQRHREQWG